MHTHNSNLWNFPTTKNKKKIAYDVNLVNKGMIVCHGKRNVALQQANGGRKKKQWDVAYSCQKWYPDEATSSIWNRRLVWITHYSKYRLWMKSLSYNPHFKWPSKSNLFFISWDFCLRMIINNLMQQFPILPHMFSLWLSFSTFNKANNMKLNV